MRTDIAQALSDFRRNGFAVLENAVSTETLESIRADYELRLDALSMEWLSTGALSRSYEHLPLEQRFQAVINEVKSTVPDWIQHFNIALPSAGITEESPIHLSRAVFEFVSNPCFVDIAETIIGPEVSLNPIGLVRIKLPEADIPPEQQSGLTARAVWHQDRGVGMEEFNQTSFVTVWIPVTEATIENGCLLVIPGSHRGELIDHCPGGVTSFDAGVVQIPEKLLPGRPVPVPMQPGSALLLDPLIVHSSGPNTSRGIRWSFDLRYQRSGDPTGRPEWPSTVLRSAGTERIATYEDWRDSWLKARADLALLNGAILPHRWDGALTVCG